MSYELSVMEYRQKLQNEFGYVSEALVKEYATARYEWKNLQVLAKGNKDLEYQLEVLEKMKARGSKPCEIRAQEKYIQRIKNENN